MSYGVASKIVPHSSVHNYEESFATVQLHVSSMEARVSWITFPHATSDSTKIDSKLLNCALSIETE